MIAAHKDSHESVAVYCLNISFVNRLIRAKVHVNFYFWNSTLRAFPLEHWDSVTQWFIPRYEENPVCLHVFQRGIFMYQNCGFGDVGDTVISKSPWFVTSLLFFSLLLRPPPRHPNQLKHWPKVIKADDASGGHFWRIRQWHVMALQVGGTCTFIQRSRYI